MGLKSAFSATKWGEIVRDDKSHVLPHMTTRDQKVVSPYEAFPGKLTWNAATLPVTHSHLHELKGAVASKVWHFGKCLCVCESL